MASSAAGALPQSSPRPSAAGDFKEEKDKQLDEFFEDADMPGW